MAKKVSSTKTAGGSSGAKSLPAAPKKKSPAVNPETELRRLDREIVKLLNQRTSLHLKWLNQQPSPVKALFAPGQDEEVWQNIEQSNHGPLPVTAVRSVFRELLSGTRGLVKTRRVAYLGPAYTYTHIAAMERFGTAADFVPVSTIASVFEEVNRGRADFGIVPIENSTDGRIVDTLDMFTRLPLKICAEVQLAIHHNLLATCERSEITEIYSKPQALSQCREWLNRNMPQARLIEVTSTSTAAQLARDKQGAAAVASRQAASQYDLNVIAEDIQDNKGNVTRFAVIGDEQTQATGRDKTAVLLQIPHEPGSLSDALVTFKNNKVNLTWIESFPLRGPEAGYLFFLDFEGHVSEPKIKKTIAELEKKAVRLELLGSYPRSEPID
ncbi:MAG: prephenate dehydratase [Planctomycetaceae bacterium]|nr:prephenate dehydratase [Planctomycetaceae bacterium]